MSQEALYVSMQTEGKSEDAHLAPYYSQWRKLQVGMEMGTWPTNSV